MIKKEKGDKFYKYSKNFLLSGQSASARWNDYFQRPVYFKRGDGAYVYDMDDNKLIDMCISHGASILGHNNRKINQAIKKATKIGMLCAYETKYQTELAEKLCTMIPCSDVCRFSCSGTEAVMHSIRLAREYSGKNLILKFEGHYHGLSDYLQYSWSPVLKDMGTYSNPKSVPFSGGIPEGIKKYIKVIPFNDLEILEKTIEELKTNLAAVILEPINYNQGCIVPDLKFLKSLRYLTKKNNILLIFDEVLSAFRTGTDCAQGYFKVIPDICVIGKSVGGGTPISVIAGRRSIMEHFKPIGACSHSGTYNGHLIPTMAALATLDEIIQPEFYKHIYKLADKLYEGFDDIFSSTKLNIKMQGLGARFGFYFNPKKDVIRQYRDRLGENKEMALTFYQLMYEKGVYFHGLHHGFSIMHSIEDMERVLNCTHDTIKELERIF
jgi:glutamate-1-semialdehyde 2,1-aminomutase